MENKEWLMCPICTNKTRMRLRLDTILKKFPLYCPKCKQETLIDVREFNIKIIKEPDAKAQSH
jgi:Zn-finger nucleic acid-binding protein